MFLRWQVVSAFNIITEATLFALSIYLVAGLHMSMAKKSMVIIAFGLRLPVIAACVLRLHYLAYSLDSSDPTFDTVLFVTWTEVELAYSIMAATIPCLKPFVSQLNTYYGSTQPLSNAASGAFSKGSPNGSYGLRQFSSKMAKSEKSRKGTAKSAARSRIVGTAGRQGDELMDFPHKSTYDGLSISHKMLRGDSVCHTASANMGRNSGNPKAGDGGSTWSNDSQQMIIRKEVCYSVEHAGKSEAEVMREPSVGYAV